MKEIKWAVLGCGVIANEMAVALQKNGKNIYAVGNRTYEKAAAFAEKYGIGKVYDDFHEMFTDPEVDVIYITTPHNTHLGFMKEAIANADGLDKLSLITQQLIDFGIRAGERILIAVLVFVVGRFLISLLNKFIRRLMDKRKVDVSIKTFVRSLVNILLTILLIISVVGALGVETTSFAALLASAGVAVGMALSGNLQNFAGGLVILLFKPYKVGDWIETQQGSAGTVKEIQIFHTILTTGDNKLIYIPNGSLSSGVVINYSHQETRRVEWIIGIDYGEDYNKVQQIVRDILAEDKRILNEPAPFIALHALDASSVNVVVRVWVNSGDYWGVYFDTNKAIYETFNEKGINFPFPQLTVHQGN